MSKSLCIDNLEGLTPFNKIITQNILLEFYKHGFHTVRKNNSKSPLSCPVLIPLSNCETTWTDKVRNKTLNIRISFNSAIRIVKENAIFCESKFNILDDIDKCNANDYHRNYKFIDFAKEICKISILPFLSVFSNSLLQYDLHFISNCYLKLL